VIRVGNLTGELSEYRQICGFLVRGFRILTPIFISGSKKRFVAFQAFAIIHLK